MLKRLDPHSIGFTLLIGALVGLPPLSIDMGLPGLPRMQEALAATPAQSAMVISLFFVGFGGAQLVLGPLSDRIGRRPVLLGGLTLYALAGAACALAPTIEVLLASRFAQGVGAAGGTVLAFAIVRDVFDGAVARARLSTISVVFAMAPVIAPTIGGWMLHLGDWRAIYVTLAVAGLLLTLAAALGLPETRPPGIRHGGFYRPVLRQRRTVGYALASAMNGGTVLAFVTGSPLVLLGSMGLTTTEFGIVFAVIAAGIMAGAAVNGRLVARGGGPQPPLAAGLGVSAAAGAGLCVLAALDALTLPAMMPLLLATTFCRGLVSPNATHAALEPVPDRAGAASAVMGSLQMLMGALAGMAVGVLFPALGPAAMAVTMAAFGIAALCTWMLVEWKS